MKRYLEVEIDDDMIKKSGTTSGTKWAGWRKPASSYAASQVTSARTSSKKGSCA